jgi:acetyl esterase
MPPDPQVQVLLDQLNDQRAKLLSEMTVAEARAMMQVLAQLNGPGEEVGSTEDLEAPGPDGPVPVRIYRPGQPARTPPALLVWLHGGGWVIGDVEAADATARQLCNGAGVVVASVDYPLAPEMPFPAPPNACYAATAWLAAHGSALGAGGPVAIGGDSAGGNLAAVTALTARDRGGPDLRFQLLVYPATDLTLSHPSISENGDGFLLTADSMRWFVAHYLAGDEAAAKDPLASPLWTERLDGLPPALVITAELDPLRDEGEAYGRRLAEAGVAATVSRYDGQIHGFFGLTMILDGGKRALADACTALRAALA